MLDVGGGPVNAHKNALRNLGSPTHRRCARSFSDAILFCARRSTDIVRKKTPVTRFPPASGSPPWLAPPSSPAGRPNSVKRRGEHVIKWVPLFTYGGHIDPGSPAQVVSGAKMAGRCESDPLALPSTCTIHVLICLSY